MLRILSKKYFHHIIFSLKLKLLFIFLIPISLSLCVKLLNRNPKERLGAREDSEEIKSHPFFKDLNWDDLLNGKIKLPPIECSKIDTSQRVTVNYDQNPKPKK